MKKDNGEQEATKRKFYLIIALGVCVAIVVGGLVSLQTESKAHQTKAEAFNAAMVINYMDKHGFIEDAKKWQQVVEQTDHGKKIQTIKGLNEALYQGNKHSAAINSPRELENVKYPSVTTIKNVSVLNMPAFYSKSRTKSNQYIAKAQQAVKSLAHQDTIVLNFAHNTGGDLLPMTAGLSALIPDGTLYTEVDNKQRGVKFKLYQNKLSGSLSKVSYAFTPVQKVNPKRIFIIMDDKTASAAERTVMALKTNPSVRIIGVPSGGFTSVDHAFFFNSTQDVAIVTIGTITSAVPIKGQTHFNNDPLLPDITTLYHPISPAKGENYTAQQPLDPDFVEELSRYIPEIS